MEIDNRFIGMGQPPYVIAEVSGNHGKELGKALQMIDIAKACGADAVKFQTYKPDSLSIPSDLPEFRITSGTWKGWTLYELYQEASTPYEWFPELFRYGREIGITVFSSPFDTPAVDLLAQLDAPAYKIASNELTDWPLIERTVATGRPVILSTGTATLLEIDQTVEFLHELEAPSFALLHCISAYPAPVEAANLKAISELASRFNVPIGLSDHSLGTNVAIAATALGAAIIEKHFVMDRSEGGPDSSFALEPDELKELVDRCRETFTSLGDGAFGMKESEKASPIYRKRFYSCKPIEAGQSLSENNVRTIRSPHGIEAKEYRRVYSCRAVTDIPEYTPIGFDMLTEGPVE